MFHFAKATHDSMSSNGSLGGQPSLLQLWPLTSSPRSSNRAGFFQESKREAEGVGHFLRMTYYDGHMIVSPTWIIIDGHTCYMVGPSIALSCSIDEAPKAFYSPPTQLLASALHPLGRLHYRIVFIESIDDEQCIFSGLPLPLPLPCAAGRSICWREAVVF